MTVLFFLRLVLPEQLIIDFMDIGPSSMDTSTGRKWAGLTDKQKTSSDAGPPYPAPHVFWLFWECEVKLYIRDVSNVKCSGHNFLIVIFFTGPRGSVSSWDKAICLRTT